MAGADEQQLGPVPQRALTCAGNEKAATAFTVTAGIMRRSVDSIS
jgi:hypothetical protein